MAFNICESLVPPKNRSKKVGAPAEFFKFCIALCKKKDPNIFVIAKKSRLYSPLSSHDLTKNMVIKFMIRFFSRTVAAVEAAAAVAAAREFASNCQIRELSSQAWHVQSGIS